MDIPKYFVGQRFKPRHSFFDDVSYANIVAISPNTSHDVVTIDVRSISPPIYQYFVEFTMLDGATYYDVVSEVDLEIDYTPISNSRRVE